MKKRNTDNNSRFLYLLSSKKCITVSEFQITGIISQFFAIILILLTPSVIKSQTSISSNGSEPHPSAMLDIKSADKGLLIPRVNDTSDVTIKSDGLLVYKNSGGKGFYYFDSEKGWIALQPKVTFDATNNICNNNSKGNTRYNIPDNRLEVCTGTEWEVIGSHIDTLVVEGELKLGNTDKTCDATTEGSLRYNGGKMELCSGGNWTPLGNGSSNGSEGSFSGSASTTANTWHQSIDNTLFVTYHAKQETGQIYFYDAYIRKIGTSSSEKVASAHCQDGYDYSSSSASFIVPKGWEYMFDREPAWAKKYVISSGGGGTTKLEELTDINISSPADKSILVYNSSTQKWENKDLLNQIDGTDFFVYMGLNANISIPNTGSKNIGWDKEVSDAFNMHEDANPTQINIPVGCTGKYLISYSAEYSANSMGSRFVQILKNGSISVFHDKENSAGDNAETIMSGSIFIKLNENDYIEMISQQNSNSAINLTTNSYIRLVKLNTGGSSGNNGGASEIVSLTDVAITTPANNSILKYNTTTTKWEDAVVGLWEKNNSDVVYMSGNTGIGTMAPKSKLDVNGDVKLGNSGGICNSDNEGAVRYNSSTDLVELCDGNNWKPTSMGNTSSMSSGWPDFIKCNATNPALGTVLLKLKQAPHTNGLYYYDIENSSDSYFIVFNADYRYNSANSTLTTTNCTGSISDLYANEQAFDLVSGHGIPAGAVMPFNLSDCPPGWKIFEAAKGRTVIGTGHGSGLTNRILGNTGGSEQETLTVAQLPAHSHNGAINAHGNSYSAGGQPGLNMHIYGYGSTRSNAVASTGSGQAHNNMPPYVALLYCEKE